MLVMVVFFSAFRWIHLSTSLIMLLLVVLILLWMPTLNFLPVWLDLSLLRFRLPSRLPMMFILSMVVFFFKQKTAYDITRLLEFRRVLFRSLPLLNDFIYIENLHVLYSIFYSKIYIVFFLPH